MPKSGKVLVLDACLSIRKAFFALVFNNVRLALVWHAPTSSNIGVITISDFINMLIAAYDAKWVRNFSCFFFKSKKYHYQIVKKIGCFFGSSWTILISVIY
jgi:hypothetical protein